MTVGEFKASHGGKQMTQQFTFWIVWMFRFTQNDHFNLQWKHSDSPKGYVIGRKIPTTHPTHHRPAKMSRSESPESVNILPYIAEGTLQIWLRLRSLTWKDNPGLSSIKVGPIKSHKQRLFPSWVNKKDGREIWNIRGTQSTTDFGWKKEAQAKDVVGNQKLGMVLSWQLARKWESQSYNCNEINSTNNPNEKGNDLLLEPPERNAASPPL